MQPEPTRVDRWLDGRPPEGWGDSNSTGRPSAMRTDTRRTDTAATRLGQVVVFSKAGARRVAHRPGEHRDALQPSFTSIEGKPARQKFRLPPRDTMGARRRAAGEVTEQAVVARAAPRKASGAEVRRTLGTRRRPSSGGRGRKAGGGGATEARALGVVVRSARRHRLHARTHH